MMRSFKLRQGEVEQIIGHFRIILKELNDFKLLNNELSGF